MKLKMLNYEQKYYQSGYQFIVGTDEAGRGPLAGPLVAAAVILPPTWQSELINDSKKLSSKKREELFELIQANALAIAVSIIDPSEVDDLNVYRASQKAMIEEIKNINHRYDLIISDAMPLPNMDKPVEPLIKADAQVLCVAAASIIAKVTRDHIMDELAKQYPAYDFEHNKGYGTKKHLAALHMYGPVRGLHRFSYQPVQNARYEQLKLL
jgi:ribonuclease HII